MQEERRKKRKESLNMDIELLSKDKENNKLSFLVKGIDAPLSMAI